MKSERVRLLVTRNVNKFSPRRIVTKFQEVSLSKKLIFISLLCFAGLTSLATCIAWSIYEQYLIENLVMEVNTIAMEDEALISYLQAQFLISPPPGDVALNLTNPDPDDLHRGQTARVQEAIGDMRNGFFIEARAHDGESRSNTLVFERLYNWTGLLIESEPLEFRDLEYKHRRAYLSPSCLSRQPYPTLIALPPKSTIEHMEALAINKPFTVSDSKRFYVQCFPLFSYIVALGNPVIDYLSLDIYGGELEVLEAIPWERVNIRVLSVKHMTRLNQGKTQLLSKMMVPSSKNVLDAFMLKKGYKARNNNNNKLLSSIRPTVTIYVKY